jgi:Zn-dependent protease with chaperone function
MRSFLKRNSLDRLKYGLDRTSVIPSSYLCISSMQMRIVLSLMYLWLLNPGIQAQVHYPAPRIYGDQTIEETLDANYKRLIAVTDFGTGEKAAYVKRVYQERYNNQLELLNSGSLLIQSPLQNIMDSLLSLIVHTNHIESPLRVFVTDDLNPNAYATGDGMLFVNIGLLPHFHTTEELIYVLCHEIAHDVQKHTVQHVFDMAALFTSSAFKREVQSAANSEYRKATKTEMVLRSKLASSFRHKQKKELEADSIGLQYYLALGLPKEHAFSALWTLKNIDTERDYSDLDVERFVQKWFGEKAQPSWTLTQEGSLGAVAYRPPAIPDSLRTHPEIPVRVRTLMQQPLVDTVMHPEPSSEYLRIVEMAQSEIQFAWFEYGNYGRASFILAARSQTSTDPVYTALLSCSFSLMADARKNRKLGYYLSAESEFFPEQYNKYLHFLSELSYSDFLLLSEKLITESRLTQTDDILLEEIHLAAEILISVAKQEYETSLAKMHTYESSYPKGLCSRIIAQKKQQVQTNITNQSTRK